MRLSSLIFVFNIELATIATNKDESVGAIFSLLAHCHQADSQFPTMAGVRLGLWILIAVGQPPVLENPQTPVI
jgi:hypothetical protein